MYAEDLAHVHDAGYTELAEAAARMVIDVHAPGTGVDLGCGGGTLAEILMDAGHAVHGIDVSPSMVALAKRRVPTGSFEVADVAQAQIPECDIVTAVGEVLCYACPDGASFDAVLSRVRGALRPGGVFLFDVATTGRATEPTRHVARGRDWRVEATAVEADGWLTRTIDTWRIVGHDERHSREVHRLRLFDAADVLQRLAAAGFDAEQLGGYDDYGFQPGWDGFLARRRA